MLDDADELTLPTDIQMVVLPFVATTDKQRQEMADAAADGRTLDVHPRSCSNCRKTPTSADPGADARRLFAHLFMAVQTLFACF